MAGVLEALDCCLAVVPDGGLREDEDMLYCPTNAARDASTARELLAFGGIG